MCWSQEAVSDFKSFLLAGEIRECVSPLWDHVFLGVCTNLCKWKCKHKYFAALLNQSQYPFVSREEGQHQMLLCEHREKGESSQYCEV